MDDFMERIHKSSVETTKQLRILLNKELYTISPYPCQGNWCVSASNTIFASVGMSDLDSIYKLAKVIEKYFKSEISDRDLDVIHVIFLQLVDEYRKKPM